MTMRITCELPYTKLFVVCFILWFFHNFHSFLFYIIFPASLQEMEQQ